MTIRLLVRTDDAAMPSHVGGSVLTTFKTFDVELPEVEAFLSESQGTYAHRQLVGVEVIPHVRSPND